MTRLSIAALAAITMFLGCGTQEQNTVEVGQIRIIGKAAVTAYTSHADQPQDATPCIAADTTDICQRYAEGELICATADRNIKFGTQLGVPGYGICTVADRMNKRFDGTGKIDVYLGYDLESARKWGLKKLKVTVMNPTVLAQNE